MPEGSPATWSRLARLSLGCRSLYPFALVPFADIEPARRPQTRILDVPCGGGVLAAALASAGFAVTPADLFPEYLAKAQAARAAKGAADLFAQTTGAALPPWLAQALWGPSADAPASLALSAAAADMEGALPFPDASFDYVACLEGIEHVVDRHKTLREFRRVLAPGGRLVLTTPNLMSLRARLAFAFAGQRAFKSHVDEHTSVWGVSPDGTRTYHGHAFLLTYFQLRYSLYHCGFRIRRMMPSNWSVSSLLTLPLAPLVAAGTWASQRGAKRKFARIHRGEGAWSYRPPAGTVPPFAEMFRHLMSPNLLLNATMVVEAEARP
jgi:2-polyprenyl-3-methyl-5-hydroxy-6-metoxy-1,4-benzoquinol methylase